MRPWEDGKGTILGTEDEVMAELTALSAEHAPRRFTLCLVDREADDAGIVGWGLAFDDEAVAYLLGSDEGRARPSVMRSSSPERVRRRLSGQADVRLVWVDNGA